MIFERKRRAETVNQQIKELMSVYRDAVKNLSVSESEFWIWYTLVAMDGEYTQQEIGRMWSLPKQTVNTVIAHLRRARYAYLEAVPGKRTHKLIRLTEEGRRYGETLIRPIARAEERAFESMPPADRATVIGVIGKYIERLRGELTAETGRG